MSTHVDTPIISGLGPLQLRIMHALWRRGRGTVDDIARELNAQPAARHLAYTTFLTVMRNLVRRKLLSQTSGPGRAHHFAPTIDEVAYKRAFLEQIIHDYCGGDIDRLGDYLTPMR